MGARELQKNNWRPTWGPENYRKIIGPRGMEKFQILFLYQLQTVIRAREDFLLAKYLLKIFIFRNNWLLSVKLEGYQNLQTLLLINYKSN